MLQLSHLHRYFRSELGISIYFILFLRLYALKHSIFISFLDLETVRTWMLLDASLWWRNFMTHETLFDCYLPGSYDCIWAGTIFAQNIQIVSLSNLQILGAPTADTCKLSLWIRLDCLLKLLHMLTLSTPCIDIASWRSYCTIHCLQQFWGTRLISWCYLI